MMQQGKLLFGGTTSSKGAGTKGTAPRVPALEADAPRLSRGLTRVVRQHQGRRTRHPATAGTEQPRSKAG